ncbi:MULTISPECIES: hypothetical protein [unclassified Tolypothrix]|uniref:hypothetical protein n=1 Tax=unclassified Tolypothrix TaxID=2649714 RepID=UPI0005F82EC2|nr:MULTISPECIES: hypothetical protein [unclassified Tolypothrix]BAY92714.1 NADPH-dependent FMN reductase [Microchaete diplosiphon NIES-3275]
MVDYFGTIKNSRQKNYVRFILILGTSRQGRQSEQVAKFIVEQVAARDRLETELIDTRNIALANDDAGELLSNDWKT